MNGDQRLPSAAGSGHRTPLDAVAAAPREPAPAVTAARPRTDRATTTPPKLKPKQNSGRGSTAAGRRPVPSETDAAKKRRLAEEKSLRNWEINNPRPPAERAVSSRARAEVARARLEAKRAARTR